MVLNGITTTPVLDDNDRIAFNGGCEMVPDDIALDRLNAGNGDGFHVVDGDRARIRWLATASCIEAGLVEGRAVAGVGHTRACVDMQ